MKEPCLKHQIFEGLLHINVKKKLYLQPCMRQKNLYTAEFN